MNSGWKPVSFEPLIKQSSRLGHPVSTAWEKRAGSTGRCDAATSGYHGFEFFEAGSHMA